MCAENVKSWFKSWVFHFTFQAYTLPHTLNCMCVSVFEFHFWILEQFKCCPKRPALPRHMKVSFEFFGALYMYISDTRLLLLPLVKMQSFERWQFSPWQNFCCCPSTNFFGFLWLIGDFLCQTSTDLLKKARLGNTVEQKKIHIWQIGFFFDKI